ncbi:hypothetical protein JR316_0004045 [Psilocybe cubensis]|uniref:Uncharacterized protein n=1 Tax=Psilocybe cubensis TaxID=181762 RepID=A0ACB8H991_PSICU|nr:hypothetical protein JR316_0004045 [Psilocybe cubensis]KAH9484563.1 hypothetical protein JR316_0004045 [Psilocybe cubensis]
MTGAADNEAPQSDPVMEDDGTSAGGMSSRSNSDGAGTETYSRSLFMLGHGTPVWDPIGDLERPQSSLESGVMIGDVGFMTDEGDFLCYFNVFLPPQDPIQRRCPPGFVPLHPPPKEVDIAKDLMYFPPGTALVSNAVSSSVHSSSPLDITFTVEARESAILVLPDGASREDLISTSRMSEYVQQHALDWYIYLNEEISRLPFPNGSLYIITGYDKATKWAVGTSGSKSYSRRNGPMTARYKDHKWSTMGIGAKASSPNGGYGKCAVFIRGMHVAISVPKWTASILYHQPPAIIHYFNVLSVPVTGLRAKLQSALEARSSYKKVYVKGHDMERMFHPTEVILRILLSEVDFHCRF